MRHDVRAENMTCLKHSQGPPHRIRCFVRPGPRDVIIAALVALAASAGQAADVAIIEPVQIPPFGRCMGDCDGDEEVTIGELLRGVRIALDEAPPSVCEAGGTGSLGIAALTSAVRNALLGCI